MPDLLSEVLHPSLRHIETNHTYGVALPVTLEYWIDAAGSEGGDGTEDNAFGPVEGLSAVQQELLSYARIDQCLVHVVGDGTLTYPALPFDGAPFGSAGRLGIVGEDYNVLATGLTAASGSTLRIVLASGLSGGVEQYVGKTIEVLTGAAAGDKRTIRGHVPKYPCRVASTATLTLSGTQTIDGVACIAGDRVLAKDQSAGSQNGIWVVAAGAWTRAKDADNTVLVEDAMTTITAGSTNAGTTWYQTTATITVGTHAQTWVSGDIVITPAMAFTASILVGATFRIVEPAATLAAPPNFETFATGFAAARHVFPSPAGGLHLVNLISHHVAVSTSTIRLFGFEIAEGYLTLQGNCHTVCGRQGAYADTYEWLGQPNVATAWEGWGCHVNYDSQLSFYDGFIGGALVIRAYMRFVYGDRTTMSLQGGRMFQDLMNEGGTLTLQPVTVPFVLDACGVVLAQEGTLVANAFVPTIWCRDRQVADFTRAGMVACVELGQAFIRSGCAYGWSAYRAGLATTTDGTRCGGRATFVGALTMLGTDSGDGVTALDARTISSTAVASAFSAAGTAISATSGDLIARCG